MIDLDLKLNEGIIMQSHNIGHGGLMSSFCDDLILTNLNIIHVQKGILGGVKNIQKFPNSHIKVVNGCVQVFLGKDSRSGNYQLEIYFKQSQEFFKFQSAAKKEISDWINNINNVITGEPLQQNGVKNIMALPGTEQVAVMIKDTIGSFKDAMGIKPKKTPMASGTCKCCGASLSGEQGSLVKCKFCESEQVLL